MAQTDTNNPLTTPQAPTLSTHISVSGEVYDLSGLTIEEGLAIYDKLPANYQRIADTYAQLAGLYESTALDLPPGMEAKDLWTQWVNAPRDAAGKLAAGASDLVKKLDAQVNALPGVKQAKDAQQLASDTNEFTRALFGVPVDMLLALPRGFKAAGTIAGEAVNGVVPSLTNPNQRKAFGAAVAATILNEGIERQAMKLFDSPFNNERSLFWSYPVETVAAAAELATLKLPVVRDAWPWIAAMGHMVLGFFGNEKYKGKSLHELVQQVKDEITEKSAGRELTIRGLVEEKMRGKDIMTAGTKLAEAKKIVGIETAPIVTLAKEGGVFNGQDGKTYIATAEGGVVTPHALKDKDGSDHTRGDRVLDAAKKVGGGTLERLLAHDNGAAKAGVAAGVAAIAVAEHKFKVVTNSAKAVGTLAGNTVRGAAAATTGVVHGAMDDAAHLLGGKQFHQARKADAKLQELTAKKEALLREQQAAKAAVEQTKAAKTEGFGLSQGKQFLDHEMAQNKLHGIEQKLEKVEKDLTSRKGFLGRTIKGATEKAEGAHKAVEAAKEGKIMGIRIGGADKLIEWGNGAKAAMGEAAGKVLAKVGIDTGADLAASAPVLMKVGSVGGKVVSRGLVVAAPVISGGELAYGIANKDNRQVATAGTELTTMAAGAGIGASIGLFGGPAAPVTVPAGAALGFMIGGLASIATGLIAGVVYDKSQHAKASPLAQPQQPEALTQAELAAAHERVIEQARAKAAAQKTAQEQARASVGNGKMAFAVANSKMGAVTNPVPAAPQASAPKMADVQTLRNA